MSQQQLDRLGITSAGLASYFEPMFRDLDRATKYADTITKEVGRFQTEQDRAPVVLDIGCGSGLLTALALRAGAAAVLAYDVNPTMALYLAPQTLSEEDDLAPDGRTRGGYETVEGAGAMRVARTAGLVGTGCRGTAHLGIVVQHPRTVQVVRIVHGRYEPTAKDVPMVDMWVSELLGTLTTTEYMPSILLAAAPGLRRFNLNGVNTQYAVPRSATQFVSAYAVPVDRVRSFEGGTRWHATNDVDAEFPPAEAAGPARARLYTGHRAEARCAHGHTSRRLGGELGDRAAPTEAGRSARRQVGCGRDPPRAR